MNKVFFPALLVFAILLTTGCSEKFKVAAPYKNITVIYGMLDQADAAHYIRVQKAFLDENKSAVTMAQTADSNFYNNIDVHIRRIGFDGTRYDSIHLSLVDLDTAGFPKATGVFFNTPNYAYKFTNLLDGRYLYRIYVHNPATNETDSADAPVIEDKNPDIFWVDVLDTANNALGLDFAKTGPNDKVEIRGEYRIPPSYNFSFQGLSNPTAVAQLFIGFNWLDSNIISHQKTPLQHYDYDLGYVYYAGSLQAYFGIPDTKFYSAVATALGTAPANMMRIIDRCDITMYLSTLDYYQYYQSSLTQGTGLTGSEIEPVYTNVKGANALGLYTSKGSRTGKITILLNTIDSLKASPLLTNARIAGTTY